MKKIYITVALLWLSVSSTIHAGEIKKLALLSVMGDSMSIVVSQPTVGSHIDQNHVQVLPLPDPILDDAATKAAVDAVKLLSIEPPIQRVVLKWAAAQNKPAITSNKLTLSAELQSALSESHASHLLLFTKYRAASALKTREGAIGIGTLEGIGFYIDRSVAMRDRNTNESQTGFLSPFAYFLMSLIDLSSGEVVNEQTVRASYTFLNDQLTHGQDPWEALSVEKKVSVMQQLIRSETMRLMPKLLGAPYREGVIVK